MKQLCHGLCLIETMLNQKPAALHQPVRRLSNNQSQII
jgi:hypothetical protein